MLTTEGVSMMTRPATIVTIARYHLRPARRGFARLLERHGAPHLGRPSGPAQCERAPAWCCAALDLTTRQHGARPGSPRRTASRAGGRRLRKPGTRGTPTAHGSPRAADAQARARAGLALPLIIEVDGVVAGQCNLEWIQPHTETAELSARAGTRWSRSGVSGAGAGMLVDYATGVLGLRRLIAPIAVGNTAAAWGARRIGMRCEGTMESYLDVAGERRDHQLWALTAERAPPGGLTPVLLEAAQRGAAARARAAARKADRLPSGG